jgi:hypothetical protein
MGGGWNWFTFVSSGEICYKRCQIVRFYNQSKISSYHHSEPKLNTNSEQVITHALLNSNFINKLDN